MRLAVIATVIAVLIAGALFGTAKVLGCGDEPPHEGRLFVKHHHGMFANCRP